jgi:hypothetical protein
MNMQLNTIPTDDNPVSLFVCYAAFVEALWDTQSTDLRSEFASEGLDMYDYADVCMIEQNGVFKVSRLADGAVVVEYVG